MITHKFRRYKDIRFRARLRMIVRFVAMRDTLVFPKISNLSKLVSIA